MAYGPWGNEVSASSRFRGTWITDPDNPAETVIRLRYGGVGRQNSRDRAKTALQFVGRKYPVYDVGEARAESVSVDATLSAEDGDAEEQLELLEQLIGDGEVILYRDSRGRKIFAIGTDFQAEDLDQRSYKVSFLLNRVDYDEALPEPEDVVVIPPATTPQNVTVSVDNYSGMALIDWSAIENVQLYHLYLNGVEVGSTSEDVATYGPLDTGEYSIELTATVSGAESAHSTPVLFNVARPTAPPDGGGGTTTPPTTVPQNFRAFPTASNSVTLQWDSVAGATDYQVFEIRSPNGVSNGITTSTTMVRGASTPLADGPFDYWVKARVNGVWSAESNHQQFSFPYSGGPITGGTGGGGSGGGDGGAMPAPTVVLGLRNGDAGYLHYNLGVGFTDSKGHKDYDPQTLEDWSTTTAAELANNYWTIIDAAGKYAVATTVEPNAARTSPNTSYPRCEHREMQQTSTGNNDKANWTIDSGDHDFSGFSRIMTLPPAKPGVCINQLHDQSDDTVMIKTMALSGKVAVVLDVFGTRVKVIQADYKLGIEIWSRIRINNTTLTVYYAESVSATTSAAVSGTINYTHPSAIPNSNPPWYHKFGCYAQSNETTDTSGTKCLVQIRDWKQWHTGWPAPVTGNYAGPGGSGGTGAPIVAAGADATVVPGATFSRTGQVVGSGITAQGWRLVGSGASTTDQSTAAGKYSWGVPSAESDEFNYTGNPDATKWSVYDGTGHGGNGIRSPLRVSVANGIMTLTGLAGSANTAGLEHKLDRQYGKWEFRARSYYTSDPGAPGDKTGGYHPVGIIWSDHDSWPLDGEYDFLENGEPGQQAAGAFLHYPSLSGGDHQIDVPDYPVDLRQFHNFAIEWTSASIKLYVDGLLWYTASGGSAADRKNIQAMSGGHLTLQLDAFQATGLIGSAMEIDWVRTYPVTPILSNPQISTSAQLNWIAPTTPGSYTLEFFATNGSGTSTDQVLVSVAAGTPTGGGEGSAVPVGQTTTFTEDFENGNFARWTSVQNKSYEGSASSYNLATTYSQKIVNQNVDHPHALRTEVRDGDTAVGSHERAELSSFGKSWNDQKDQERWYEFYVRFGDPTWNVSWSGENDWLIFYQWHQPVDDGAPALAMSVHNDNKVYFEREPDSDFEFIGPLWTVRPGVWEKVVVHIKWSPSSTTGFVHAYLNDAEVLPKKMCKTQYSADYNDYYVKLGTYRRNTVSGTSVVMHDNIRISGPPAG